MTAPVLLHLDDEPRWLLEELARRCNVTPDHLVSCLLADRADLLEVYYPESPAGLARKPDA